MGRILTLIVDEGDILCALQSLELCADLARAKGQDDASVALSQSYIRLAWEMARSLGEVPPSDPLRSPASRLSPEKR